MTPTGQDLEQLLSRLRAAGLVIGPRDLLRLRHILRQGPELDAHGLREVVVALLARSREEVEKGRSAFDAWAAAATLADDLQRPRPNAVRGATVSARTGKRSVRRTPAWRLFTPPAALALTVVLALFGPRPDPAQRPLMRPSRFDPAATVPLTDGPIIPPTTYRAWVPERIVLLPAPWPWANDAIAFLAVSGGIGIWLAQRNRSYLPNPAPEPTRQGLAQVYVEPPEHRGAQILQPDDEETLIWGIGRFVNEETTTHLDVLRSVRATADNAGLPTLHFEHMRHTREVWLWVDEALSSDEPAAKRLADELEAVLRASGLPVERADFWGIPDRLRLADGSELGPNELDERRDAALVVILTDGHLLDIKLRAENTRVRMDALLRELSSWPRLAFVDFSDGGFRLARHAARHEIPTLAPRDVPAFLGGRLALESDRPLGDVRAWAAGLALSPQPVDDDTAYALARRLATTLKRAPSPWALESIRARAAGPGGRLLFTKAERIQLLRWLASAEELTSDAGIPASSLLGVALGFWRERYREDAARRAADKVVPWTGTPAEQRQTIDSALLDLWDGSMADAVAGVLFARYKTPAGELSRHAPAIRQALAPLAARDQMGDSATVVRLPWALARRSGPAKVMLLEMGLGADLGTTRVPALARPGRLWLAFGLCGGLAAVAVATRWSSPAGFEIVDDGAHTVVPASWFRNGDTIRVELVTRREVFIEDAPIGSSRARIEWVDQDLPCVVTKGDSAIRYCGNREGTWRPAEWPLRSLVEIRAKATDPAAIALASSLLDGGSADAVRLTPSAGTTFDAELFGGDPRQANGSQLLVLMKEPAGYRPRDILWNERAYAIGDFAAATVLLESIRGPRAASQVWPDATDVGGVGDSPRLTASDCPRLEGTDPTTGATYVRVCGGTFTMGEDNDEHVVTISPFWIMKTEVTRRQFGTDRKYTPFTGETPEFPATDLSWWEAKRWCEEKQSRLPTEAEWEYAARGNDGRTYPWGNAEPDDSKARFGKNWGDGPVAVGSYPDGAGPFGTLDQAGNVWEWGEDCYAPYGDDGQDPVTYCHEHDNVAVSSGAVRVLRGGSFVDVPGDLRSAFRIRFEPEFSFQYVGFRCVRAPRRQGRTLDPSIP